MIGIITGVRREAACLGGRWRVACSGADAGRAGELAARMVAEGVSGLVSFGLAGGLAEHLNPGDLVVPDRVTTEAGETYAPDPAWRTAVADGAYGGCLLALPYPLATPEAKRRAATASGAVAVDMESGAVGRVARDAGLPFLVVRAIADPLTRSLPPAALAAVGPEGEVRIGAVLAVLASAPAQVVDLTRLSLDSAAGLRRLKAAVSRLREPDTRSPAPDQEVAS